MKSRILLIGAAVAALGAGGVLAAFAAEPDDHRGRERHEMRRVEITRIDANGDKFITRAEAQAEAARVFDEMDTNHDGKLDAADHGPGGRHFMHRSEFRHGGERHVEEDVTIERDGPPPPGEDRKVVIEERRVQKGDGGPHGDGPRPPHPPRPPMFLMIYANSEEADRNSDGALSKEEFVTQQLRFFDASDANGDGKIKFDPPPRMEPPEPPAPPQPPNPPAPPQPPRR